MHKNANKTLKIVFIFVKVKMSNNITANNSKQSSLSLTDINSSNQSILVPFGAIMKHYMNLKGFGDRSLAKAVGCDYTFIFRLRKGQVKYCGFSILSRISITLGFRLADWFAPIVSVGEANVA